MNPPITADQFFDVFSRYNQAVWPMQIILYCVALLILLLPGRGQGVSNSWISAALAFLWAWMAIAYHWIFFAPVNPAAYLFGALFLAQAALLLESGVFRRRLWYHFRCDLQSVAGITFILYALVVYPGLGVLLGHAFPRGPTFGLPCPTTIFTFGMLLLTDRPIPARVIVIPTAWSVVGASAALSFGILEDIGLVVAGAVGTSLILLRKWRWREGDGSIEGAEAVPAIRR